jgi:hypothetical protein
MTDGRDFRVLEGCLRMLFRRDGILDADDGFSSSQKTICFEIRFSSSMIFSFRMMLCPENKIRKEIELNENC